MQMTLAQLARHLNAELSGDGAITVRGIGPLEAVTAEQVTFVSDLQRIKDIAKTNACALIVSEFVQDDKAQLKVKNVSAAMIETINLFFPEPKAEGGIDPTAKISEKASIGEDVSIGPNAVIEDGVEIAASSFIGAGCFIGKNTKIGKSCRIDHNVVIYHGCEIGSFVIIQANSTIGGTGFGYAPVDGMPKLIPHVGNVVLDDYVEIGANCCVDRAKFGRTHIGAGTKMDNLVQIGHNVQIGKCCLIVSGVGIGGSAKVGNGVVLAGQVAVSDHVTLGDGVMAGAKSLVIHDVVAGTGVFGIPAIGKNEALRVWTASRKLPKVIEQLRQLERRLKNLEAKNDKK
ncbi:MAG: UDP-3-O-(3-hydroxymyristoyl)glucosamine N-acyltransferase [Phycisphaerae bacterium]|nr:UDP-3-O-(3-hydroxymyristoyl)glucosamine N-acyltransferase [Phycisphaerae bacterium]